MKNIFTAIKNKMTGNKGDVQVIELPRQDHLARLDPLDHRHRTTSGWSGEDQRNKVIKLATVKNFPFAEISEGTSLVTITGKAMDSSELSDMSMTGKMFAMDSCGDGGCGEIGGTGGFADNTLPPALMAWYASQSFFGHQACAIIGQHWLVDKACSMAGEDAIRNGWEIKASGEATLSDEEIKRIKEADKAFNLMEEMKELNRFKNIFGIRILLFKIDSDDPEYYEKPFNIDGVTEGSYKGISQIDPYWTMPMLSAKSTSDPASPHFYEPEFWIISGKKYHRSHLIIVRGPEPADILKPTYLFGGIPMTQRIYERVYAAERTANEAPLLATNKRTTAIHVDMEKAVADQEAFEQRLLMWIKYRDNSAVKVLGQDEVMEQFDTSLSDFDSVVMNQYQIVSAIAKTPATKLLGTSPKGFNATGEHETISYHEELESIQQHTMSPFLERHYMLQCKSMGINVKIVHVWESVDSVTMKGRAELNKIRAETGKALIDGGVISPDEERVRVRDDKHSGYNRLEESDANDEPGMSPENIAKLEKSDSDTEKAQAAQITAGARVTSAESTDEEGIGEPPYGARPKTPVNGTHSKPVNAAPTDTASILSAVHSLAEGLQAIQAALMPDGDAAIADADLKGRGRSVKPGVHPSAVATVTGQANVVPSMSATKLPKVKRDGLIITVENPKGTTRQGMDISGNRWSSVMSNHYGFINGTKGADGEEIDCFLGPNAESQRVFVINQMDGNVFDEHKCMIGFSNAAEAKEAYSASFSDDWKGMGAVVPMSMGQFKAWIKGDCTEPVTSESVSSLAGV